MDFLTILFIAIGLSFDSFAVSVSNGLSIAGLKFRQATRIAFVLAFSQGIMPLIGWFLGVQVEQYVRAFDHWIAFGLLLILGLKMIIESLGKESMQDHSAFPKWTLLIGMGLATSVDALVVGVSFAFVDIQIFLAVMIIGMVTFIASMTGLLFGKTIGGKFGKKIEILGGIILIAIGIRILLSHFQH